MTSNIRTLCLATLGFFAGICVLSAPAAGGAGVIAGLGAGFHADGDIERRLAWAGALEVGWGDVDGGPLTWGTLGRAQHQTTPVPKATPG